MIKEDIPAMSDRECSRVSSAVAALVDMPRLLDRYLHIHLPINPFLLLFCSGIMQVISMLLLVYKQRYHVQLMKKVWVQQKEKKIKIHLIVQHYHQVLRRMMHGPTTIVKVFIHYFLSHSITYVLTYQTLPQRKLNV